MYLREVEMAVTLADEKNMTRAAEKLFVTPSAVNQQLAALEKNLGTPLFHRSRGDWALTPAGEIYVRAGREMLRLRKETINQIGDIATNKEGSISVGFPPDRAPEMIRALYPVFHQKYPKYKVLMREVSVRRQQQMVASGELDISFQVVTDEQRSKDTYIPIVPEEILLAAPSGLPQLSQARPSQYSAFPEISLNLLKDQPFAQLYRSSTLRDITDRIFRSAGMHPDVIFETSSNHTIVSMASDGICCGLVPDTAVPDSLPGVSFFSLPGNPSREICISYAKGAYVSSVMEDMIEMAIRLWSQPKFPTSIPGKAPEKSARSY